MLTKVKVLEGYKLNSLDGELGKVKNFYFDDTHWTVRYLVADTGNWLTGRKVLLSPYALTAVNKEKEYISVDLSKKQIENSPSLESDQPVSKQFEESYYGYYDWPMYTNGQATWGALAFIERNREKNKAKNSGGKPWDPDLRSTDAVTGYNIEATDGEIGHVEDFVIDDESWTIRYLVIDTRNWLPGGKKVLISPLWIDRVSWDQSKVFVNLTRKAIENSPEYSEVSLVTRDYENKLCAHYKKQGYWNDAPDSSSRFVD